MERDDETGLYLMGARYYAAWLGRWTSADPMGIGADGPGIYNYTRGSPVTLSDPNGHGPWSEGIENLQKAQGSLRMSEGQKFFASIGPAPQRDYMLEASLANAAATESAAAPSEVREEGVMGFTTDLHLEQDKEYASAEKTYDARKDDPSFVAAAERAVIDDPNTPSQLNAVLAEGRKLKFLGLKLKLVPQLPGNIPVLSFREMNP